MKISRTEPPMGRWAAVGARMARGDVVASPRGSEHQSCTKTGQSSDPSDDYMLRAALKGTHVFSVKTDMPQKLTHFLVLLQLAKRLCPFKLYRDSVQGGMVDSKSYCTVVKTHRDETSQVTGLSPGLTTCDTERRSPAHPPPLARAPRDEITACDQVPHSDQFEWKL